MPLLLQFKSPQRAVGTAMDVKTAKALTHVKGIPAKQNTPPGPCEEVRGRGQNHWANPSRLMAPPRVMSRKALSP